VARSANAGAAAFWREKQSCFVQNLHQCPTVSTLQMVFNASLIDRTELHDEKRSPYIVEACP
jgi:hypothetical protein